MTLFNLKDDPTESQNLLKQGQHLDKYLELDASLSPAIMRSITQSHFDKRVYTTSLSQDPGFGKEGWQRVYPNHVGPAFSRTS
jgi:hypothetical protein